MHVDTADYNGNPNIGLFCYANNKYCLVPSDFPDKLSAKFEKILKVPVHKMRAAGTDLLGVFFSGNDDVLLVPMIMFDSELAELRRLKINYRIIESELTALGNNLIVTEKACIANPDYTESMLKNIEKDLGVKAVSGKISKLNTVGSLVKIGRGSCLVTPEIEPFEEKFLKDKLKIAVKKGTVNFGSPYISSGVVCNSNGFIIGEASGGPEIQNADEALGFIDTGGE
ncbi:TPA: translation initiation factor IF-6 [Candidatus Woesearchaeota archaeon]|nr:Translation initiation factor 6 [archaeon GW2011_AR15]MBS3104439.1 translation initiation factor IF-6 [Candidatus Woesearchaeota archaeon]HIH41246.1 translation initiation factor IF-6 [Candidatus Woesearchaeota archaeon]